MGANDKSTTNMTCRSVGGGGVTACQVARHEAKHLVGILGPEVRQHGCSVPRERSETDFKPTNSVRTLWRELAGRGDTPVTEVGPIPCVGEVRLETQI